MIQAGLYYGIVQKCWGKCVERKKALHIAQARQLSFMLNPKEKENTEIFVTMTYAIDVSRNQFHVMLTYPIQWNDKKSTIKADLSLGVYDSLERGAIIYQALKHVDSDSLPKVRIYYYILVISRIRPCVCVILLSL